MQTLPSGWIDELLTETRSSYFAELSDFVDGERSNHDVFPPDEHLFAALDLTSFESVCVVVVGQDPYHDHGQAHGLAFSVPSGVRPPPSLRNIFNELHADIGVPVPTSGDLSEWARQGVLLLNTVLTVRAHEPNSHRGRGWETFTDAVIRSLNRRDATIVFLLWGAAAQSKRVLIDEHIHSVIASAHPSPLSARHGFTGSRPFTRTNELLERSGQPPIDWRLDR